jgi:RNA-directed DNA polymerase
MTNTPITLHDLRERIYVKAKADKTWRFWGLYVHVCKMETLLEAYVMAWKNDGAPGIDGVTFKDIEESGEQGFLEQLRSELVSGTYRPAPNRKKEIPKDKGKFRTLGIPCIRDRVVQGALKLILEPIFEADFQEGSFGYRHERKAQDAANRVSKAAHCGKTTIIDVDLEAYFDNVRHDILLQKVAARVNDPKVMHLLKLILKAGGKRGVPQGGPLSPLLANLYLNEVDKMLEKAKVVTKEARFLHIEYARFADDLVVLVDGHPKWQWLVKLAYRRLFEEFGKLDVRVNEQKSRIVDLWSKDSFGFVGFDFRLGRSRKGKLFVMRTPRLKSRTKLLQKLKDIFRRYKSQPIGTVIFLINPILRGWVNYFRAGNSAKCFSYIKNWVERKVRRHLQRARQRSGFGWKRWSRDFIYKYLKLYQDYQIRYC